VYVSYRAGTDITGAAFLNGYNRIANVAYAALALGDDPIALFTQQDIDHESKIDPHFSQATHATQWQHSNASTN